MWRTQEEKEQWADDHGYMRYRCPKCHKTFYDDSSPVCPSCGEDERGGGVSLTQ